MLVAMAATTQSPKKSYKVGLPISSTAITLMKIAVPIIFKIKRFIIKKAPSAADNGRGLIKDY